MIGVTVNQAEMDMIRRNMKALQDDLGRTAKQSVKSTAYYVAKAASAAARIAPKVRKIVKNKVKKKELTGQAKRWWSRYAVVIWRKGARTERTVPAVKSVAEAKRHKLAQIGRRGLAKSVWQMAGRTFGFRQRPGVPWAGKHANAFLREYRIGAEALIENNLSYAGLAFKKSGRATEQDIVSRAANNQREYVERQMDKMKAKAA
jgi:hypothetical protein